MPLNFLSWKYHIYPETTCMFFHKVDECHIRGFDLGSTKCCVSEYTVLDLAALFVLIVLAVRH